VCRALPIEATSFGTTLACALAKPSLPDDETLKRQQFISTLVTTALKKVQESGRTTIRLRDMRLGYELGYAENLTRPTDLKNPDNCPRKPMTRLERLYVRTFGLPDTIRQQQACAVFSILDKSSFSSVLDIGCAQGQYAIRIAKKYPSSKVKGVDIREEQLNVGRLVRRKLGLKNLTFERRDICDGSTNEKHDLVLLLQVIEHLKDDRMALKEIRKLASSGGHLIITAPNSESPIMDWCSRYVTMHGHYREGYALEELAQMIRSAHFNINEIRPLSGNIGQIVDKVEIYLAIKFPVLFALTYPLLNYLVFLDDFLGMRTRKPTSGVLIVATAT